MQQVLTVLGWILAPVCASLITAYVAQRKELKADKESKKRRDAAMEQGMRALLRQKLIDYHREYVASGGPCPVRIKEQATAIHDAYVALGGNGTGTQLWNEIMEAKVE